jgi:hypothetical protein
VVVTAIFAVVADGDDDCVDVAVLCCFDAVVGGDAGFDIVVLVFAIVFAAVIVVVIYICCCCS